MNKRKCERHRQCRNKMYSMRDALDEELKKSIEAESQKKLDWVPEDAPEQCKDCKLVRMKCYNPMKKQFGENFICDKKITKEVTNE